MTAFDINHNGYLEINERLLRAVGDLGTAIDNLNDSLRNIPHAAWGGAQPIWLEQQASWNQNYGELVQRINTTSISSINIHEIFRDGDQRGTRIMLG